MQVGCPQNFNLSVPFKQTISGGLSDGMVLVISGTVQHHGDRFSVNLQCDECVPCQDIAFHFNPRFDEGAIVCNTKKRQNWGNEERKCQIPFHKGHHFEIRILVKNHGYMVSVNGNHFLEYKHRIPLHSVNTLQIEGNVNLDNVNFQGAGGFPQPFPSPCPPGGMYNPFPAPPCPPASQQFPAPPCPPATQQFPVPYRSPLHGGFYPSKTITISGSVPHHAQRFHVNLRFHGGIAFHMSARFDENALVRNSQLNNQWGQEERSGGMPFSKGQSFTIVIKCEHHCLSVSVNGQHNFNFNHRVHVVQQIDSLEVEGDVTLLHVQP